VAIQLTIALLDYYLYFIFFINLFVKNFRTKPPMKKIDIYFMAILMVIILSYCKKKEEAAPNNTNTLFTDICTGNGGTSYYPLQKGNQWVIRYASPYYAGGTQAFTITDTLTADGKKWYKQGQGDVLGPKSDYIYFWVNSNGDIYKGTSTTVADSKLWIPANPVINSGWKTFNNDSLTVETTSDTFPDACNYTDILIINKYSTLDNSLTGKYYYKKGVGLIVYWNYYNGVLDYTGDLTSLKIN
jgi:hypothetical protein